MSKLFYRNMIYFLGKQLFLAGFDGTLFKLVCFEFLDRL